MAGSEIEVQFNPASLKLELANKIEGGDTRGRQNRQYLGKTSTTLTFDLHFDTADQGTPDAPVSVRTLHRRGRDVSCCRKARATPSRSRPRRASIGTNLIIDGIIESVSIDFDLFAANGTPLRAKMGVSIKEQDAKYELLQSGPGANQPGNATPPGAPGTGPGSSACGAGRQQRRCARRRIGGRLRGAHGTRSDGMARNRRADSAASSSLSLSGRRCRSISTPACRRASGLEFPPASRRARAYRSARRSASMPAPRRIFRGAVSADTSAGFAIAAAGGVGAAIETVAIVQAQSGRGQRAPLLRIGGACDGALGARRWLVARRRSAPPRFRRRAHRQSPRRPEFRALRSRRSRRCRINRARL